MNGFLYVLDSTSCCHNVGTQNATYLPENYSIPLACLCGNDRIMQSEIDMGCYETWGISTGTEDFGLSANNIVKVFPNPSSGISDIRYQISDI